MQSLYKRVCEYMELDQRVEVLNNRFQVCYLELTTLLEQASWQRGLLRLSASVDSLYKK